MESGVALSVFGLEWHRPLHVVVNDLLLPLFFFVAGLELKRELVRGELSSLRVASLPLTMAIGGMGIPPLVYLAVSAGTDAATGWGIPVATDIAFALALVGVLGDRVPNQVRIALLAFAALDDVGGVIIIAATDQSAVAWLPLASAGALLAATYGLQRLTLLPAFVAILSALATFVAVMVAGLHPTLAGIALGMTIPAAPLIGRRHYLTRVRPLTDALQAAREQRAGREARGEDVHELMEEEDALLGRLEALTIGTESVLDRLSRTLNPWVSYLVLPLFALANGGVTLDVENVRSALSGTAFWGVFAGLGLGKPLGIVIATWVAVRLGLARLPAGMAWGDVAGLGLIAGIGFTVSLFIAELAFAGGHLLIAAKLGILAASVVSGLAGAGILAWMHRRD